MTTSPFATPCDGWSSHWATPLRRFRPAAEFLASPRLAATDCLVADVHMPEMTGVELFRHLIGTGQAIPTILVTAYPDDRVQERMLSGSPVLSSQAIGGGLLIDCLRCAVARG